MEFLTGFFTSLFANNLFLTGKGVSSLVNTTKDTSKKVGFTLLFYFIAAILLGLVAYGLTYLTDYFADIHYFYVLILVGSLIVISLLYYLITMPFKRAHEALKEDGLQIILSTATFAIALAIITLVEEQASLYLLLANIIGLPLGYLLSVVVFRPVVDRIAISNAPNGFKGGPLILISSCIIVLAFSALTF